MSSSAAAIAVRTQVVRTRATSADRSTPSGLDQILGLVAVVEDAPGDARQTRARSKTSACVTGSP
jgi:hypothetical protein